MEYEEPEKNIIITIIIIITMCSYSVNVRYIHTITLKIDFHCCFVKSV